MDEPVILPWPEPRRLPVLHRASDWLLTVLIVVGGFGAGYFVGALVR